MSSILVALLVLFANVFTTAASETPDGNSDSNGNANTNSGATTPTPSESGEEGPDESFDICIIGAGAGGIQLAYFLEQSGRSYVVLERNSQAASFFAEYPRHRNLISINKKSTPRHGQDREFRMRHDWNSLLSTPGNMSSIAPDAHTAAIQNPSLLFGHWSDEYYPKADAVVEYVNHFATHFELNVRYNALVEEVVHRNPHSRDSRGRNTKFMLSLQNADGANAEPATTTTATATATVGCDSVVAATGLAASYLPPNMRKVDDDGNPLVHGYEDVPLDREFYRNKDVLILGKGNAAFELASNISAVSATTAIVSRSQLRLSYVSFCSASYLYCDIAWP